MVEDIWSDRTGEKYIYRYRSGSVYTMDELLNNYIYLTDSKNLNDLNDCRPYFTEGDLNPTKEEKLELISKKTNHPVGRKVWDLLTAMFLTDPDGAWKRVDLCYRDLMKAAKMAFDEVSAETKYGVCCFSKKALNQTMMAHYGNNEGLIICYDMKRLNELMPNCFSEVRYRDNPVAVSIYDIAFGGDASAGNIAVSAEFIALQKHTDWSYEEEIRLVSLGRSGGPLYLNENTVAGICVAANAPHATIRVACKVAEILDVQCWQAVRGGGYEFNVEPREFKGFKKKLDL